MDMDMNVNNIRFEKLFILSVTNGIGIANNISKQRQTKCNQIFIHVML